MEEMCQPGRNLFNKLVSQEIFYCLPEGRAESVSRYLYELVEKLGAKAVVLRE
jgi:hypothetical protein